MNLSIPGVLGSLLGADQDRGPVGAATGAVFVASCVLGAGMIASCELRATAAGQCSEAYKDAAVIVAGGAGPRVLFETGFQTLNPKLRPAAPLIELPRTEGPGPDPDPRAGGGIGELVGAAARVRIRPGCGGAGVRRGAAAARAGCAGCRGGGGAGSGGA